MSKHKIRMTQIGPVDSDGMARIRFEVWAGEEGWSCSACDTLIEPLGSHECEARANLRATFPDLWSPAPTQGKSP
jgi:hypothetical protein